VNERALKAPVLLLIQKGLPVSLDLSPRKTNQAKILNMPITKRRAAAAAAQPGKPSMI
jgi:hypothetical protein